MKFKIIAFTFIIWFVSFAGTCDSDESFTNTGSNNDFCFIGADQTGDANNQSIVCGFTPPTVADQCAGVPKDENGCSCESLLEGSCP